MNIRLFAALACLLSLPCGLALLADPAAALPLSGVGAVDRQLAQLGRYFGSELLLHAATACGLVPGRPLPWQTGSA